MAVLGVVLALWAWMLFQGYSADDDAFGMLHTWQILLSEHRYQPSRFQGSVIPELMLGAAAWLGGPFLSNLAVLICTLCALGALWGLMSEFGVKAEARLLALAALAANGPFLIAGASSMDYTPALALFVGGLWLLARGEDVAGVLLIGATGGARISYSAAAVLAIPVILVARQVRDGQKLRISHLISYPLAAFVISGLFYLPIWFDHGLKLDWLTSGRPLWQGVKGLAVRFVYKIYLFFGLTGLLGAAIGLALDSRRPRQTAMPRAAATAFLALCGVLIVFHLALFLYIPAELSYLIPGLAFLVAALATFDLKGTLIGLCLGQLLTLAVVFDPLEVAHRPTGVCGPVVGEGARIHPHLEPGFLIQDLQARATLAPCNYAILKKAPADPKGRLPSG
jgi:hypothetical protein